MVRVVVQRIRPGDARGPVQVGGHALEAGGDGAVAEGPELGQVGHQDDEERVAQGQPVGEQDGHRERRPGQRERQAEQAAQQARRPAAAAPPPCSAPRTTTPSAAAAGQGRAVDERRQRPGTERPPRSASRVQLAGTGARPGARVRAVSRSAASGTTTARMMTSQAADAQGDGAWSPARTARRARPRGRNPPWRPGPADPRRLPSARRAAVPAASPRRRGRGPRPRPGRRPGRWPARRRRGPTRRPGRDRCASSSW